jgi:hypothetical protein
MTGETVELSLEKLRFRQTPAWSDENTRWMGEDAHTFWQEVYHQDG